MSMRVCGTVCLPYVLGCPLCLHSVAKSLCEQPVQAACVNRESEAGEGQGFTEAACDVFAMEFRQRGDPVCRVSKLHHTCAYTCLPACLPEDNERAVLQ